MTASKSATTRQALNLHIEPSAFHDSAISLISIDRSPSSSSSAPNSGGAYSSESASSSASPAVTVICSVLCMHDFSSDEEHALPFRRNEILEVVKREDTGWWAAMRKNGPLVGWIPEAFVKPLSDAMAERLRVLREELRVYEYQAEQLYNAIPTNKIGLIDSDDYQSHPPAYKSSRGQTSSPPQASSSSNALNRSISRDTLSGRSQSEHDRNGLSPPRRTSSRKCKKLPPPPPSPTSPMPHPPAQSAPLYTNKPVPPLPHEILEVRTRASSLSSRSLRRRPLIVNDNTALSRLSTLIETKNTREIDKFANPDVTGSFHALAKRTRGAGGYRREGHGHHRGPTSFEVLEKAWYILPAHADELELDQEGQVRAGSLLGLIERLTSSIPTPQSDRRERFASVFLMTFRTFTTSEELFDLLLDRFSMTRPDNLNEVEVEDWKRRSLIPTQRHVLDVFTLWLEEHRLLEEDPHIAQRLPGFIRHVVTPRLSSEGQALLQLVERLTFAEPARPPMGIVPKKPLKHKDHKNDLLRVDPGLLADQLTLYEYSLYNKVTPRECLSYVRKQSGPEVEGLVAFCATYDKLGSWVKTSILSQNAITKRAHTIDHWIKVAERCRANNNYASMSSIISAVSSVAITRLTFTWTHSSRKAQLDALLKHNEPSGGFAGYRSLLRGVEEQASCVPFITMYLTDLMRTREQFSDEINSISFIQRQRWHDTITAMLKFQNRPAQQMYDEYISTFVRDRLREVKRGPDDPWFWEKSQELLAVEHANADIRKGLEQAGF